MKLGLTFLATAVSLWVAVWLVDGLEFDGEWYQFLIIAAIMGLANTIVKPILKLFSLPLILLTLGLFLLIVNALVLQLVIGSPALAFSTSVSPQPVSSGPPSGLRWLSRWSGGFSP